jgi:hypothetical protein
MNHADRVKKLVEGLSQQLKGAWGKELSKVLTLRVAKALRPVFSGSQPRNKVTEVTAWAANHVGAALKMQFGKGLPRESKKELLRAVLTVVVEEIKGGVPVAKVFEQVTGAAKTAVENWALSVAEALTNEFLQVMSKMPDAEPEAVIEKPARRKAKSKKSARPAKRKASKTCR